MKKIIVFTDLDGTLLDHKTYSFDPALPALRLLKEKAVPLIICSSKTRSEIEHYRTELDNSDPFISENGGGIFIPRGYFSREVQLSGHVVTKEDDYQVFRLGAKYSDLRRAMTELRREGFPVKGFGDMTAEEVAEVTSLGVYQAEMAKQRDFDEPFVFEGGEAETPRLLGAIESKGLAFTQGRFFHILGSSDKGRAVSILSELYKKEFGEITTVAVGDSPNDIPMLKSVDIPVIVQEFDGAYDKRIIADNLIKAEGIGPKGWGKAVMKIISVCV
jgi:mannosyl-3-phosphoglycerate phosphatase